MFFIIVLKIYLKHKFESNIYRNPKELPNKSICLVWVEFGFWMGKAEGEGYITNKGKKGRILKGSINGIKEFELDSENHGQESDIIRSAF